MSLVAPEVGKDWTLGDERMTQRNESGELPGNEIKDTFSAENERGEGITGREQGVRY